MKIKADFKLQYSKCDDIAVTLMARVISFSTTVILHVLAQLCDAWTVKVRRKKKVKLSLVLIN
jgi:hypothetical protein